MCFVGFGRSLRYDGTPHGVCAYHYLLARLAASSTCVSRAPRWFVSEARKLYLRMAYVLLLSMMNNGSSATRVGIDQSKLACGALEMTGSRIWIMTMRVQWVYKYAIPNHRLELEDNFRLMGAFKGHVIQQRRAGQSIGIYRSVLCGK